MVVMFIRTNHWQNHYDLAEYYKFTNNCDILTTQKLMSDAITSRVISINRNKYLTKKIHTILKTNVHFPACNICMYNTMCCKMTNSQLRCWDTLNTKMSLHTVRFTHHMKSRPGQILQHMSKNTKTQHTNDHRSYIYAQCTKNH
jgi:hypothetical protein